MDPLDGVRDQEDTVYLPQADREIQADRAIQAVDTALVAVDSAADGAVDSSLAGIAAHTLHGHTLDVDRYDLAEEE